MALLLGHEDRVLLAGHQTRDLCRVLATAGCRVSSSEGSSTLMRSRTIPSGRFDAVGLVRVVEYLDDPVGLLRQAAKMLTRDGCIAVAVPNITHGSVRLRLLAGQPPHVSVDAGTPNGWRGYNASSLKELLGRAGFVVTRTELCQARFDSEVALFDEPDMRKTLLDRLAADTDALTSAYVVVGHKSPLSKQVQLELRMRELSTGHEEAGHTLRRVQHSSEDQEKSLSDLHKRQADLSNELGDLKRSVIGRLGPEPLRLKETHQALVSLIGEADAVRRDLERLQYTQMIGRIQAAVDVCLPHNAVVLVVSKGDPRLLELRGRTGWHFLQVRDGVYAGHHPADSNAAIQALEQMIAKGASHLLLPRTAFWWLDHYAAFRDYLNKFRTAFRDDRTCVIHVLDRSAGR